MDELDIEGRYRSAATLMQGVYSRSFVPNAISFPVWIGDSDCFWYERELVDGREYRFVNVKVESNEVAFDHSSLAASLGGMVGKVINACDLPITSLEMSLDLTADRMPVDELRFFAFNKHWLYKVKQNICCEVDTLESSVMSPDGSRAIFSKDCNLWMRDLVTGEQRQLTNDGEADFAYGASGSAWGVQLDTDLQVCWSPDSKKILAVRRDTRGVLSLPIVRHVPSDGSLRPTVETVKIAFPGDDHIETMQLLSIDIENGRIQWANYMPIPTTRNSWSFFKSNFGWWANDSRRTYFVHVARNYKSVRVCKFDTDSGATETIFEEATDTHISLMADGNSYPTFLPMPTSGELLWFSERSGWGHLYLYDLESGVLSNAVTAGEWIVCNVIRLDCNRREAYIQTAGRFAGRDPYLRDLVRVHIDTGEITTLIASDHNYWSICQAEFNTTHARWFGYDNELSNGVSPSGDFAIVTKSRADEIPISLLLDRNGTEILEFETADISSLPSRWRWPECVKVLADDGETDLYGLVYRPSHFSSKRSYPVVSHILNTPEHTWVPKGSFSNAPILGMSYWDAAALAELGFIVVQIDGRGTPLRSKRFHDESYGRQASASNIDDHVAGIRQLAQRYPYMDLQRVGITAHALGGSGAVEGLLKHPNFYRVGVASMFPDSRLMACSLMSEKYEGITSYKASQNYLEAQVDQLQGKLLLMGGMLDFMTPPAGTFRLVEALQKSNMDFDMLLLPNLGHASSSYLIRRAWDYLVENLLEVTPPKNFKLTTNFGG